MKLDKLWISEFKNLKDIEIDFDQGELVTVVIGWNGAGKSNVIEALVIIFRDLDLHKEPLFSYKLEYICRGNRILVDATDTKVKKEQYKVLIHEEGNAEKVITDKYIDFFNNKEREYLPSNVFGYYSGPSDRLATHFYDHQRKFRDQLLYPEKYGLDEKTLPLRPLFYAQKVHSNFVLLSFFLSADEKVKKFLKEKLFIEDIESVLFVLNKPDWTSKEGDPRFWNATGVVRPFLDRLFSASLAPMRKKIKVPHPMKKNPENVDALFLYLKDIEALQDVGKETSDKDFFKLLESIYFSNLIHEVRIRVKIKNKNGTDESLTFRELSEGEQQLITVLGLLRFTRDDESLFLLDEPDTHLNPAWSMEYINFLKEVAGFNLDAKEDTGDKDDAESGTVDNSHIVLATHDPIVISTLKQEQIKIMKRDEDSLKVFAASPLYEPKGMGFSGILMSDMFGLRSDLDPKTLAKLDEHAILLAKEERSEPEEKRYKQLQEQLDKSGFLDAYSDPYFSAFVKAWGRKHGDKLFSQTFLSDGDRKQLADMTDEILAELDAEEAEK
ncbi:AAA family ATPase [Pseudoalteromonas sp. Z9A5]|uniref:AAA family ATPase n=1 Tax=Pseudoalteromonas sp. Z9A5 TaxID=2686355 RepID=UPI00140D83A4|nr:AAA family ATPase [Pseudoalteromonas sp. Z9A5]